MHTTNRKIVLLVGAGLILLGAGGLYWQAAQRQARTREVKQLIAEGKIGLTPEQVMKRNPDTMRFFQKVEALEEGMSVAQVDRKLGIIHQNVEKKVPYNLLIEGQKTKTKVQTMPQYTWVDPKSKRSVVIEFDSKGMTSVLASVYGLSEDDKQVSLP